MTTKKANGSDEVLAPRVRILAVKTRDALKKSGNTIALEHTLQKLHSHGYVATCAIPVRLREVDGADDQFMVESFLLSATQLIDPDEAFAKNGASKKDGSAETDEPKPEFVGTAEVSPE